jgi:hypothetical protein
MQLNAALPMLQALLGGAVLRGHFLPRSVGPTSCGVRRSRSAVSQSAFAVCVGRPSFGGQRRVSGGRRSGELGASGASIAALSARVAQAACPSAVSARSRSAQAPRSTVRCSGAAALTMKRGYSQAQRVLLSPASCERTSPSSVGAGKLTVMNAGSGQRHSSPIGAALARSSFMALQGQAPNPSVKRTA